MLSYIAIVFTAFVFTYIFNDKVNFTLVYMLILAPIIDYLIFKLTINKVTANLEIKGEAIEKGKIVECKAQFSNNSLMPIFFLEYEINIDPKFIAYGNTKEYIMINSKGTKTRTFNIKAIHRGKGKLEIVNIKINSLFGLFNKVVKFSDLEQFITVYPRIVELEGLKKIDGFGESEDEDSNLSNIAIGEPAYEFKEYSEGDPLNRVNWKLSSKKDSLQVRKSIQINKRDKLLILDPLIQNINNFEHLGDLFIEGLMALAKELYCLDYKVTIYFCNYKAYTEVKYKNLEVSNQLQRSFSYYNFSTNMENRFVPLKTLEAEGCDVIIFTSNEDTNLRSFIKENENKDNTVFVIRDGSNKIFENQIILREDYSLEVM